MNTSTKHTILAFAVTALLGSCSRPVATFQPSKAARFYSAQTATAPVVLPGTTVSEPIAAVTPVAAIEAAPAKATVEQALAKAEAYASTNARPADARKLERRITKIREVLAHSPQQAEATAGTAKKSTMVQRMMQKSMDKKIQKHLAPEQPMRSQTLTIGLVVGLIGLLLVILNVAAPLGLIALVVGIVLIILGLV